jgi:cytochrome c553
MRSRIGFVVGALVGVGVLAGADCGTKPWSQQRAERQQAIDAHVAANWNDWMSFKNEPVGNLGVPVVMFRLFPEIFPDIWGPPEDRMAVAGFGQDPYEPDRVIPFGIGISPSDPIDLPFPLPDAEVNVAQLACSACHMGKYQDADGNVVPLIGAPSSFLRFPMLMVQTVNDPRWTASNFRLALAAKPPGWVYGYDPDFADDELAERAIFTAPSGAEGFLDEVKNGTNARKARFDATIGTYAYDVPNPPRPIPGSRDVLSFAISILVDPTLFTPAELEDILPDAPAPIDIMAVWRQGQRPNAQWDGSVASAIHRNVAASFALVGAENVNVANALASQRFQENLPSPPYPFSVNLTAAKRGKAIYNQACAGCHAAGSTAVYPPSVTGTDPNRVQLFNPWIIDTFVDQLRSACDDPVVCNDANGDPLPDEMLAVNTQGYSALPLNGVWATAPYLHNGSVPTLYHLLAADERPATFQRGNPTYDTTHVGYTWDAPGPASLLFDTSDAGYSNSGHAGPAFNGGIDWDAEPQKLWDLLEHLKTL